MLPVSEWDVRTRGYVVGRLYGWVGGGGSWIRSCTITLRNPADVKAARKNPNPLCDTYLCSSPYACSKEAPMIDLGHLRNRPIILKMTGMSRAIKADVVCEEKEGVWFSGEALMSVLVETGLPVAMKTPAIFVPLSQIQWLIAENQQGEAI